MVQRLVRVLERDFDSVNFKNFHFSQHAIICDQLMFIKIIAKSKVTERKGEIFSPPGVHLHTTATFLSVI